MTFGEGEEETGTHFIDSAAVAENRGQSTLLYQLLHSSASTVSMEQGEFYPAAAETTD